jgi:transposase
MKILWHDGIGMSLYAKRLERGRFIWPSPADGVVAISAGHRPAFHGGGALEGLSSVTWAGRYPCG